MRLRGPGLSPLGRAGVCGARLGAYAGAAFGLLFSLFFAVIFPLALVIGPIMGASFGATGGLFGGVTGGLIRGRAGWAAGGTVGGFVSGAVCSAFEWWTNQLVYGGMASGNLSRPGLSWPLLVPPTVIGLVVGIFSKPPDDADSVTR